MELVFRHAVKDDLPNLIEMLAEDALGSNREDLGSPINKLYITAFDAIENDPNNELIVLETTSVADQNKLPGMLQLTFIPYLTHTGSRRCLIEGVRIHKDYRSQGLGKQSFDWAIKRAKLKGCNLMQLTSNKQRKLAIEFYRKLGFIDSHEGFKLEI